MRFNKPSCEDKIYEYIYATNVMVSMNEELAEICGIHAGDGYLRNDGQRIELDISGNIEESEYFDKHVSFLFKNVFDINLEPKFFPARNTYGIVIRERKIEILHSLGFTYGNKTLNVRIPQDIMDSDNKRVIAGFLRGLFDTDGNLSFRKYYGGGYKPFKVKNHTYPVVSITTVSRNLFNDVSVILNRLDIQYSCYSHKSKRICESEYFKIIINGAPRLQKWMELVGMKNFSKYSRYLIWERHGFCPTKLNLQQRKDILNNKLDPYLIGL